MRKRQIKVSRQVVVIYQRMKDAAVLMGPKTRKIGKGRWMLPGGKNCKKEEPISAARREGRQETGLKIYGLYYKGQVRVSISKTGELRVIDLFLANQWTGTLKPNKEFSYLQFRSIAKIPWYRMLPWDEAWLRPILENSEWKVKVHIQCGADRNDVTNATMHFDI